jgi:2-methylcitrate dehydratase
LDCINITMLAAQGMTGPIKIFEGPKGVKDVFDMELDYDWSKENFELISKCILKKYNAEVHAGASIEAALLLQKEHGFTAAEIEKIQVNTFITAYHIIGSGSYGDRKIVHSKEQADHSLFYVLAAALVAGEVYPEQFEPSFINRDDVQELLQKIEVDTVFPLHKPVVVAGLLDPYTQAYPDKMKTKVTITLKNGKKISREQEDYHGFFTRPFSWEDTIEKFNRLTGTTINARRKNLIVQTIKKLDQETDLGGLLKLICEP